MDFQLNDEQLQLKKSVREFAEREIAPNVMKWDEAGEFPLATVKELGKLGLLGNDFSTRVRRRRHGLCRVRHRHRGALARGRLGWHHRCRAHLAVLEPYFSCRAMKSRRRNTSRQAGDGRVHRRLGTDRTVVRIGRGRRAHDRGAQRQQLGAERHQDFHHQRPLCRCRGRDRGDRSRPRTRTGCRRSSWRKGRRAFVPARKKTSWACAPATLPN